MSIVYKNSYFFRQLTYFILYSLWIFSQNAIRPISNWHFARETVSRVKFESRAHSRLARFEFLTENFWNDPTTYWIRKRHARFPVSIIPCTNPAGNIQKRAQSFPTERSPRIPYELGSINSNDISPIINTLKSRLYSKNCGNTSDCFSI